MLTVNIHEAKTHLSRLNETASQGENFIIAKAGKPFVKEKVFLPHQRKKNDALFFRKNLIPIQNFKLASFKINLKIN